VSIPLRQAARSRPRRHPATPPCDEHRAGHHRPTAIRAHPAAARRAADPRTS